MSSDTLDRYVRHAERYGTELVYETAAGLGQKRAELSITELVALARRLKAINPAFNLARPDPLVELSGAEFRGAYLDRLAPVLDVLAAPVPTSAFRRCEWCGRAVAGRSDRRTCSDAHRKALDRAGGVGLFSGPDVTPTDGSDLAPVSGPDVRATARRHRRNEPQNRGVGDSREVFAGVDQLELFEGAPTA